MRISSTAVTITAAAIMLIAAPFTAADGLTPLSQIRTIGTTAGAKTCDPMLGDEGASADDFGPFVAEVLVEQVCEEGGAIGFASQDSTIEPTRLAAAGSTSGQTIMVIFTFLLVFSDSDYFVTFELDAPARIHISGVLTGSAQADDIPSYWVISSIRLTDEEGLVFEQELQPELNGPPAQETVDSTFVIDAGLYTFRVRANANITDAFPTSGTMEAAFDVVLDAFNLADVNVDGIVNVLDLLGVLAEFGPCPTSAECIADINEDLVVNVLDILAVLEAWGATGP